MKNKLSPLLSLFLVANMSYQASASVIDGTANNDTLYGTSGADIISGLDGNDTMDGGAGDDTVIFGGNKSNYTVFKNADGSFAITGANGTATLVNIEYLNFDDVGHIEINSLLSKPTLVAHGGVLQSAVGQGVLYDSLSALDNTQKFTIESWVNMQQPVNKNTIFNKYVGDDNRVQIAVTNTGLFEIVVSNGENAYGYTMSNPVAWGQWAHVAVVYDGTQSINGNKLKLYINGNPNNLYYSGNIPVTTANLSSAVTKKIGSVNGLIDEVRVWNVARTNTQIQTNMNKQLDGNESGLIAYYNFDERVGNVVKDISGHNNDGTINGNLQRLNFLGNTLHFSGYNNDSVAFANGIYKPTQTQGLTIGAWSKILEGQNWHSLFRQNGTGIQYSLRYHTDSNNLQFYINYTDSNGVSKWEDIVYDLSDNENFLNQWHYSAVTFDSSSIKLYYDGVEVASKSVSLNISNSGTLGEAVIGASTSADSTPSNHLIGDVSEVSIFNRVLSQSEIQKLMYSVPSISDTSLVGYWPLNDSNVSIAKDYSLNHNNGIIYGATWVNTVPTITGNKIYTDYGINSWQKVITPNIANPSFTESSENITNLESISGLFLYQALLRNESFSISEVGSSLSQNINVISATNIIGDNNILFGTSGNDTLIGTANNDTLKGGDGNDLINGMGGNDTIDYSNSTSGLFIKLNYLEPQYINGSSKKDTIINIENIIGSSYDDSFVDNSEIANIYNGGDEAYEFDGDTVDYSALSSSQDAIVVDLESGSVNVIVGGISKPTDTLINIENIIGTSGNDTFYTNSKNNSINGGRGYDRVIVKGNYANYTISRTGEYIYIQNKTTDERDTLVSIENVVFNNLTSSDTSDDISNSFSSIDYDVLPSLTINSSKQNIFVNEAINFTSTVIDSDDTTFTYVWNFADGTSSTLANPTKSYATAGTYLVSVTVKDSVGGTNTKELTLSVKENTPLSVDKDKIVLSIAGQDKQLNVTKSTTGVNFTAIIDNADIATISTANNVITITPKAIGKTFITISDGTTTKVIKVKVSHFSRDSVTQITTDTISALQWQDNDSVKTNATTYDDAKTYCSNLEFANFSDWRSPSIDELVTTLDYDRYDVAINAIFENTVSSNYWSATQNISNNNSALVISALSANIGSSAKTNTNPIRCVRGGDFKTFDSLSSLKAAGLSKDISTKTVTDSKNNLQWQDDINVSTVNKTYLDAKTYCDDLTLAGLSDWRLPSIIELNTIIDFNNLTSYFINDISSYTWSTTKLAGFDKYAWYANTNTGDVSSYNNAYTNSVRCVRGGDGEATYSALLYKNSPILSNSAPLLTISATKESAKVGENISLFANATDINNNTLSYSWNFGDGTTSTLANPTKSFSAIDTYTVLCTVSDGISSSSKTISIVVSETPIDYKYLNYTVGWSLVALPINVELNSTTIAEKFSLVKSLWKYTANGWELYPKNLSITEMTTLKAGEGFWINSTSSNKLAFEGETYTILSNSNLTTSTSGWYLLGTGTSVTIAEIVAKNTNIESIWKYANFKWMAYSPNSTLSASLLAKQIEVLSVINRGDGFWVKVK